MEIETQSTPEDSSHADDGGAKQAGVASTAPAVASESERLETLTRQWGRRLFSAIRRRGRPTPSRIVHRQLLRLLGEDEALRFALLRFVDVYPTLRGDSIVADHLREYLSDVPEVSGAGRFTGRFVRHVLASRMAPDVLVARACRSAIERIGRRLIAGETPEDVAPRLRELEREGFLFSLDLLGEHVSGEEQAGAFARRYRTIIGSLSDLLGPPGGEHGRIPKGPRVNLSIKLSSLTHHFDPLDPEGSSRRVLKHLIPLFEEAIQRDVFINIDMERYAIRNLTLHVVRRVLDDPAVRGYPQIGVVMQAYLRDSETALDEWLHFLDSRDQPLTIRLVKGAYWDSEQIWAAQKGWPIPVHREKADTDRQFERMSATLMKRAPRIRTAIASHNVRSVAHALALRESLGIDMRSCEFQLLHGMAEELGEALVDEGLPVRIYVPCGELLSGMSYLVRRILENTANTSFLRHAAIGDMDERELLRNPDEGRSI